MAGAAGCCGSLIVVGSLIAAFGSDWPAHPVAGHVAIGEFSFIMLESKTVLTRYILDSVRVHLRCQLLLLLGADWLGPSQRNIPARTKVYWNQHHNLLHLDVQLVRAYNILFVPLLMVCLALSDSYHLLCWTSSLTAGRISSLRVSLYWHLSPRSSSYPKPRAA